MSLHPDPEHVSSPELGAPTLGHKLIAAVLTTLPATTILTATLWAVAGACSSATGFAWTAALIFAGFFPFSLTTIALPGTAMAARMRFGKLALVSLFFTLFVLFGPGPVFLGVPCGNGPSVLQSGGLVLSVAWASWWAMRAVEETTA
jgi:hypothetical protein